MKSIVSAPCSLRALALTGLLTATLGSSLPAAIAVGPFQNGSFETNGGNETQTITGWTINAPDKRVQVINSEGSTDGTFSVAFNTGGFGNGGVLFQPFTTLTLQTYRVTVDFGALGDNGGTQSLSVQVQDGARTATAGGVDLINVGSGTINTISGGTLTLNNTTVQVSDSTGASSTSSAPSAEFSVVSFTFTAQSANTTLFFTDASTGGLGSQDGLLDNVRVTAVAPEPSTWALLGLGAAGMCLAVARRRRSSAA